MAKRRWEGALQIHQQDASAGKLGQDFLNDDSMCLQGGQQLQQASQDLISDRLQQMLGGGELSSIVLDKAQKVQQAMSAMQS